MTMDTVTVGFGAQATSIPLTQFIGMLDAPEPVDCRTRYNKERLKRRAIIAFRNAYPDRRHEFSLHPSHYWLGIRAETFRCSSLREAILRTSRWLHDNQPDALEVFARQRKFTRAYVGRSPSDIYHHRPDLECHAHMFAPGWFADINLSRDNTMRFLEAAFAVAKLQYGRDWYFGYPG